MDDSDMLTYMNESNRHSLKLAVHYTLVHSLDGIHQCTVMIFQLRARYPRILPHSHPRSNCTCT
jgi:hypothetical protein